MARNRPNSFRRRWVRAQADTHWLALRTDIVPAVLAGAATFIVTWGSVGIRPSEVGLPILASLVVVIVYFVVSNTAEFIWHFAVAGYKNEIDDLRSGGSVEFTAARLLVLAELETAAGQIEMVRLTRPQQYNVDFKLPTAQWEVQRAVLAKAPGSFEIVAHAYKAIEWVNHALDMRKTRSGPNSHFAVIDDDRLDRAETATHEAIATLRTAEDRERNAAKQPAPLQVRHSQREPYASARFPDRPPDRHAVGICNTVGNPAATHARVEIIGIDPLPRDTRGSSPEFPAIVPMRRGGDPRMGLTLNPDNEELWDIAVAYPDGQGAGDFFVQGIAAANWPLGSQALWDFHRDERWRLRYQASADNFPTTSFTVVMAVVEGVIRCQLEGG